METMNTQSIENAEKVIENLGGGNGKKLRNSNLELLRIISILMVITTHFCNSEYGFKLSTTAEEKFFINFIYSLSIGAVDIFLIISGYFSIYSKKTILGKPLNLTILVIFYAEFWNCIIYIRDRQFDIIQFLQSLIPSSYFVNIFCVLYLISPYINFTIINLSKKQLDNFLLLLIILFAIWPTIANIFFYQAIGDHFGFYPIGLTGTDRGFTLVNFTLCYIIGAYLRITNFKFWNKQRSRLFFIFFIASLSTILVILFPFLRSTTHGIDSYDSIITICLATSIFLFFAKLDIPCIKIINQIASATFCIYLLHETILIIVSKYIISLYENSENLAFYIIKNYSTIFLTYFISATIYFILTFAFKPIRKLWKRTRIYNKVLYNQQD